MTIDDQIVRAYLTAANNRRGSFQMAMLMMASRLLVLEDKLQRAGVPFPEDKAMREYAATEEQAMRGIIVRVNP
jgi:hypothetical protein